MAEQSSPLYTPSGMRARLVRLGGPRPASKRVLGPLLRTIRANHPKVDLRIIEQAYSVAEQQHAGQIRKSGDPYITHPLAVTTILAELGMTVPTLAAALLHDVVEDTPYTLEQLTNEFGPEIAYLVDGVTKLDKVNYGPSAAAETVRKMVIAMAKDVRVLVIKLADRLHNARTWRYVSQESAERKATETLEIYAPLAHRLGMNTIKWELEDLAFATLYPKVYEEIVRLVAERAPARELYLDQVRNQVVSILEEARITGKVTGRPKHYYSVYQKMIVRGREFTDIYDLVGLRVLVSSVRDCYAVLGSLHTHWTPVPGRFKDFIASPKFNMYQSLHTTVVGPGNNPVEIQIRTYDMHRRAEYGVAAHWKYKDAARSKSKQRNDGVDSTTGTIDDMAWLRQMLNWQRDTIDSGDFLESLRIEVAGGEVHALTPKGAIKALPESATPVDFAYAVHTEVGHRTIGARVNGRLVPLDTKLNNADVVEILTSKDEQAGPSLDWLKFVTSGRAKSKIKQWFSKERRAHAIESGADSLQKGLRVHGRGLQNTLGTKVYEQALATLNVANKDALHAAIGNGDISLAAAVRAFDLAVNGQKPQLAETKLPRRSNSSEEKPLVRVAGMDDIWVKLARCCTPVPGDEIIGYITKTSGASVHRSSCTNAGALLEQPERIVDAEWLPGQSGVFLVQLQIEAMDRQGLLSDITTALSDQQVNILEATMHTKHNRVAVLLFTFEMGDRSHLDAVLRTVRKVDGVFDVYRSMSGMRAVSERAAVSDLSPSAPAPKSIPAELHE